MPNIRTYESQVGGLQPSDKGISAADSAAQASASAGRSIMASYDQLGRDVGGTVAYGGEKLQQHMATQEITKGMADITSLQDNLTQSWKDVANNADPNDTGVRDRFLELQDKTLATFPTQFKTKAGQEWAQQQVGHLRQHMFEMTAGDQAAREGSAVIGNLTIMANRGSAILSSDPTQFNTLAGTLDSSLEALIKTHPNMTPELAAKLRLEFGQGTKERWASDAVIGAIDKNPQAGRAMLASGQFDDYIPGDHRKALGQYADAQERSAREQQRADEAEATRQAKERDDAISSAITASVIQKDGSLAIPPDFNKNVMKYALLPHAEPGRVEAMINFQRAITNELEKGVPAIDDPNTYSDFAKRLTLDPDDPGFPTQKEIINARAFGHLSDKSYTFFMGALSRDPDVRSAHKDFGSFLSGYKGFITQSSYLKVDAYGDQRWMEFQQDARQYHDWARQRGANEDAIRRDIINSLPKYQYSQQQAIDATAKMGTTGLKPLPPVQPSATVQTPTSSVPAPPPVGTERLDAMRKFLHGSGSPQGAQQGGGVF